MKKNELRSGLDATRYVSRWTRRLAAAEAAEAGAYGEVVQRDIALPQYAAWPRELFSALYGLDDPSRAPAEPAPGGQWVRQVLDAAAALPEWHRLQARVGGDPWRAGLAAGQLAAAVQPLLEQLAEQERERPGSGQEGEEVDDAAGERVARVLAHSLGDPARSLDLGAMRAAASRCEGELAECDELATGLLGEIGSGQTVRAPRDPRLLAALRSDTRLQRIAHLAGRMRRATARVQRAKTEARGQTVGVELGGDLTRLLPQELAMLDDSDLELLQLARLVEGQASQWRQEQRLPADRGPIVVLLDSSGSMQGARNEWAAACAAAMMEVARVQGRAFALLHFDDGVRGRHMFADPRRALLGDVISAVSEFSGGGTNISAAVRAGEQIIAEAPAFRRADIVLITDGDSSSGFADDVDRLAARGVATWVVQIGESSAPRRDERWGECAGWEYVRAGQMPDELGVMAL